MRTAALRADVGEVLAKSLDTPLDTTFDIFLSHRLLDAAEVLKLKLDFEAMGHSVYVDWLVDDLDRRNVTKATADRLRTRMKRSRSLLFAFSENAKYSTWMPWELGFCDGALGRVAVVPVLDADINTEQYSGQEYLGLYPYVTKAPPATPRSYLQSLPPGSAVQVRPPVLWINRADDVYVSFEKWLGGTEPKRRPSG